MNTGVAHRTVYLRNICSLIKAHRGGSFYLWTPFDPRGNFGPVMEWLTQSFGVYSTRESSWNQVVWFLTTNDQETGVRFKSYVSEKQAETHSKTLMSYSSFWRRMLNHWKSIDSVSWDKALDTFEANIAESHDDEHAFPSIHDVLREPLGGLQLDHFHQVILILHKNCGHPTNMLLHKIVR